MSVVDFIQGGVRELRIARPDVRRAPLLQGFPHARIAYGAELLLEPDDAAVFVHDGAIAGVLRADRAAYPDGRRCALLRENAAFLERYAEDDVLTLGLLFVCLGAVAAHHVPAQRQPSPAKVPEGLSQPDARGQARVNDLEALVRGYLAAPVAERAWAERWTRVDAL